MKAAGSIPTFRMRQTKGFVSMRELWHAALFLGDLLGWNVVIEGVQHATKKDADTYMEAPALTDSNNASGMDVMPVRPKFTFKRKKGRALRSDMSAFQKFVFRELKKGLESDQLTAAGGEDDDSNVTFEIPDGLI